MKLRILLYAGEDGYLVAECPALPGCVSQGKTRDEAIANVREAIEGWLEVHDSPVGPTAAAGGAEVVEVAV